eukprot:15990663-Heterocapsa_arctica.AAC.1
MDYPKQIEMALAELEHVQKQDALANKVCENVTKAVEIALEAKFGARISELMTKLASKAVHGAVP